MRTLVLASALVMVGCGAGTSSVGGSGGGHHGTGGSGAGGTGGAGAGNGGGTGQQCVDGDGDGVSTCAGDCDDTNKDVYPGATETANGKDDDCDGKVDNHINGKDFDGDGANYGETDCNDDDPNIGPLAVEVQGDMVDNNCNGQTDEPAPSCDTGLSSGTAMDYAKSIGLCNFVTNASFVSGDGTARNIRTKFGDQFMPQEGASMFFISTGSAKDDHDQATYNPQPGKGFGLMGTHPLWTKPRCGNGSMPPNGAQDMTEIDFTVQVPSNANAFTYNFAFFSAEYPEYVCTDYNDRFIAILESQALAPAMLPMGECLSSSGTPACNISYDSMGQPVTINNGFFDVCDSYSGPNVDGQMVSNTCTKGSAALGMTGYDKMDLLPTFASGKVGGGTGWLKTTAPVKPGETIKLRFIVLDEGDDAYDSAVLIDNFQWQANAVTAPVTEPTIN